MCNFKPGDEVVCVDAAFHGSGSSRDASLLQKGATYVICEVILGGRAVTVEGIVTESLGYWAQRFRKVERKNDSLSIEAFLTIKPGQFEEPRRNKVKWRGRVQ